MIKSFINKEGKEVFKLDQHGNLELTGNLSLGVNGILKAHTILAFNNNDIIVVRNPEDMLPPYKGGASVVYYLGNDTIINEQEYVSGTWWEKYVLGYDCTVDTSIIYDSEFIVYEKTFRVIQNDTYSHNKEMLDLYPNTVKMVVSAVPDTEGNGTHWEVKYFDASDTLLYNDVLTSNFLYFAGYNFPFSSLDSNDFNNGSKDIVIDIVKVEALKEINKQDLSLYMPLAGGTFSGIINTTSIAPVEDGKYIIGSEAGRYKAGYFNELHTDILKAKEIDIESISLEEFKVQSSKANIVKGDGLLITDSEDDNNVKEASTLKFTDDKSKFLRQDGVFAAPTAQVESYDTLDSILNAQGKLILYKGDTIATMPKDTMYIGNMSDSQYQLLVKGIVINSGDLICIVNKEGLNHTSTLISEFNSLLPKSVALILSTEGLITFVYSNYNNGWYVKGYESSGVISTASSLQNKPVQILLQELTPSVKVFNDIETGDTVEVSISKFIWSPVKGYATHSESSSGLSLEDVFTAFELYYFDGVTTNKFLTKAGTWESVETGPKVLNNLVSTRQETQEILVSADLDNITELGEYVCGLLKMIVLNIEDVFIIQSIDTGYIFESDGRPRKAIREGQRDQDGNIIWIPWHFEYASHPQYYCTQHNKNAWDLLSINEFKYLLFNRPDAANKYGYVTVLNNYLDTKGILGLLLLGDMDASFPSHFYSSKDPENPTIVYYSEIKDFLDNGQAVFLSMLPDVIDINNTDYTLDGCCSYMVDESNLYGSYISFDLAHLDEVQSLWEIQGEISTDVCVRYCQIRHVKEATNGYFRVSDTKRVMFSPGNLQESKAWYWSRFELNPISVFSHPERVVEDGNGKRFIQPIWYNLHRPGANTYPIILQFEEKKSCKVLSN